jgi:AcrR family transcriptional regulator
LNKVGARRPAAARRPTLSDRQPTRRTEGVRTQGRSARIVEDVLVAAGEELGRVGYAALRVDDVAARSGVNKTTIYRRWPTKVELVASALLALADAPDPPDTGTLRGDLIELLRVTCARSASPLKQGIIRALQLERTHPEVDVVTRKLAGMHLVPRRTVVQRGIRRGELPEGTDVDLLIELVFAPVIRRITMTLQAVDDVFIQAVVDLVLAGARATAKPARRP